MSACEADHLHFTTTTISHREKELSAGMQVSFADEAAVLLKKVSGILTTRHIENE
jgi:hypothetical protein